MTDAMMPPAVYTLWWVAIALAVLVFIPMAVYHLATLLRTTRSIRWYAEESLTAARDIESNVAAIAALEATIGVAGEMLAAAEQVAHKLDTIAAVLERRAAGGR